VVRRRIEKRGPSTRDALVERLADYGWPRIWLFKLSHRKLIIRGEDGLYRLP
jgi:hypothetical protein